MNKERVRESQDWLKTKIEINPTLIRDFFELYDKHVGKVESDLRQAERDSDFNRIKYMIGMLDGVHSIVGLTEGMKLREEAKKKANAPIAGGSFLRNLLSKGK